MLAPWYNGTPSVALEAHLSICLHLHEKHRYYTISIEYWFGIHSSPFRLSSYYQ